ncbi:MAG: response regulator transcription factor [Candidatus Gracilibacteria bacterium]|nr:response regulator transcription factor [Candidatus Gracilibacteria bacterium]
MKITIIEDDIDLAEQIANRLQKDGYITAIYDSEKELYINFKCNSDLYIIDINLGYSENDGFNIIKFLRNKKNIKSPIIITSGYNDIEKKIYGLDSGADDYLSKPYSYEELIARIRALLRRSTSEKTNIIKYKNLKFDLSTKNIISGINSNVNLTKKDLMLIELFILNKDNIVSRNKVITSVWGDYDGSGVSDNTINVTLHNLRNKIGPRFDLVTVVGEGYILKEKKLKIKK